MKKIGLLTMPLNTNYGGIIQLVALQDFLKSKGYETILINRRHQQSFLKRTLTTFVEKYSPLDVKNLKFRKNMAKDVHAFTKRYVQPISEELFSDDELKKTIKENQLDVVIVGSDQVWRIDYMRDLYQNAFLNFVPSSIKKISYAASFGKREWEFNGKTGEIKNYLNEFKAISVREDSAVDLLKEQFGITTSSLVVDPTLLMSSDYYQKYLDNDVRKGGKGIFTYVLDKTAFRNEVLNRVSSELNMPIHSIAISKDFHEMKQISDYKLPKLEDWLRGFYEADFIVTDSFHGTIFSIIFNKPFLSIANRKRGVTRFTSILKQLEIENRLIFDDAHFDYALAKKTIDYNAVNQKLNVWREKSKTFLINAIER